MNKLRFAILATSLTILPAIAYQPSPETSRSVVVKSTSGSFLGIGVAEIDTERAKILNLKEERGVEVTHVEEDGPAAHGGIKAGDVVLEYNGQRVEGLEQFIRMVRETPAGREVKLAVSRAGSPQTLLVKTGARKMTVARSGDVRVELPDFQMPDMPRPYMSWRSSMLGIEAESLDSQLAQYFGVKQGVLVRSVVRGSAAEKAGFRAGDVILKDRRIEGDQPA
jgi:Trypsin-like serine proteases, typically periplasmic, contain C-terminal PDZ domain